MAEKGEISEKDLKQLLKEYREQNYPKRKYKNMIFVIGILFSLIGLILYSLFKFYIINLSFYYPIIFLIIGLIIIFIGIVYMTKLQKEYNSNKP
jgi:uncharacterized protein YacL